MEESMFMLHDIIHQIFTMDISNNVSKEEYVNRQIYGELFTFYLTEYIIPSYWNETEYLTERGSFHLMDDVVKEKPEHINIIDWMIGVFILDENITTSNENVLNKYRKMFKEDKLASEHNYDLLNLGMYSDYYMVGPTTQNHIDFYTAVCSGAIKNIKREFNIELPKNWI